MPLQFLKYGSQAMKYRDASGNENTITLPEVQRQPVNIPNAVYNQQTDSMVAPGTFDRIKLQSATGYVDEGNNAGIAVGNRPETPDDIFNSEAVDVKPKETADEIFEKEAVVQPEELPTGAGFIAKEGLKNTASSIGEGWRKLATTFYGGLARGEEALLRPLGDAIDFYAHKLGVSPDKQSVVTIIADGLKQIAEATPEATGAMSTGEKVAGAVSGGVGEMATVLPAAGVAINKLGPAGLAVLNAFEAAPSGDPKEVLKSAVNGLFLQGVLHAGSTLPKVAQVPLQAGVFGGLAAAEGASPEDVIAQGVLGAGFGLIGKGGTVKDFMAERNVLKPDSNIEVAKGAKPVTTESVKEEIAKAEAPPETLPQPAAGPSPAQINEVVKAPTEPTPAAVEAKTKLTVLSDGKPIGTVDSFQEASEKWSKARDVTGVGSSESGLMELADNTGKVVGHVAYNGRVFEGPAIYNSKTKHPRLLYESQPESPFKVPMVPEAEQAIKQGTQAVGVKVKTYDEAQAKVDEIETNLEKQGINIVHLYERGTEGEKVFKGMKDWKPMPDELVRAYKARDEIGASQLKGDISVIKDNLSKAGIKDADEIREVLAKYALDESDLSAIGQYQANEFTLKLLRQPLATQVERVAIPLAVKRGENIDTVADISKKTLRDAAKAVKALQDSFGVEPGAIELAEINQRKQLQVPPAQRPEAQIPAGQKPTEAPIQKAGVISVGDTVKLGKSPQPYTIVKETTRPEDVELGEQYFNVKNNKTGEIVENAEIAELKLFKEKIKPTQPKPRKETRLDQRLKKIGVEYDPNISEKDKQRLLIKELSKSKEKPVDELTPELKEQFERQRGIFSKTGAIGTEKEARLDIKNISKDALDVEKMYDWQDAKIKEKFKLSPEKIRDAIGSAIVAIDAPIQRRLTSVAGGEDVLLARGKLRGSSAKAKLAYEDAEGEITKNLPSIFDKNFGRILQSKRTIEATNLVNTRRGTQPELDIDMPDLLQSPGGKTPKEHQAYLYAMQKAYPKEWKQVEKALEKRYAVNEKLISMLEEHELIDAKFAEYLRVNHKHYSPRWFIDKIDPDGKGYDASGNPISVPDSGIKKLDMGSKEAMFSNWRTIMADQIVRVEGRVAKNDSNRALYDWVKKSPDNILKTKIAAPDIKNIPGGMTAIKVMIKGEPQTMLMPIELAKYWIKSDPLLNRKAQDFIQLISGQRILKATATGVAAPEFVLTNIPMDMLYKWFGAIDEYSSFAPKFIAQTGLDYGTASKHFKQMAREYIDEYGGMDFLSESGLMGERKPWEVGIGPTQESIHQLEKVLGTIQNRSEMLGRLALRLRVLKNLTEKRGTTWENATSKEKFKATQIARNALDFSQGGSITKLLDNGIAYLNAGVQGGRGLAKAFKKSPTKATFQAAQLAIIAGSLSYATRIYTDILDKVSERERIGYWIIPVMKSKDEQGNDQWMYLRIRKDPLSRTFTAIGDSLADKLAGKKVDGSLVKMAMSDLSPVGVSSLLPPSMAALVGYVSNKDFWRNEDIWKGAKVSPHNEVIAETPNWLANATDALSKIGIEISPERGKRSTERIVAPNAYTAIAGGITDALLPENEKIRKTVAQQILSLPGIRKIIGMTKDYELTEEQKTKAEKAEIPTETEQGKPLPTREIRKQISEKETTTNDIRVKNNVKLDKIGRRIKADPKAEDELFSFLNSVLDASEDATEYNRLLNRAEDKWLQRK